MGVADMERIRAFERRFARAQATEVVDLPWGFALLQRDFPLSEYHNRVVVTAPASADAVLAATDEALGGAGLQHRYIEVQDDVLGQALTPDLVAAGYQPETIATMTYGGPMIGPPGPGEVEVRSVSLDEVRPAIIRDWQVAIPDASDDRLRQLVDRTALYARGADLTRLAVYDGPEIAAHADLYLDPEDHLAQFENLVTHEAFQGRGYATALIHDALRRSRHAASTLSFLTAGIDDWPRSWYHRLGYTDAARTLHFTRRK